MFSMQHSRDFTASVGCLDALVISHFVFIAGFDPEAVCLENQNMGKVVLIEAYLW